MHPLAAKGADRKRSENCDGDEDPVLKTCFRRLEELVFIKPLVVSRNSWGSVSVEEMQPWRFAKRKRYKQKQTLHSSYICMEEQTRPWSTRKTSTTHENGSRQKSYIPHKLHLTS